MISNKAFDFIRFLSEIALTAFGAFYFALGEIWGLPYGEAVMATCAALSTFLGIFTEWQRQNYNKKNHTTVEQIVADNGAIRTEVKEVE